MSVIRNSNSISKLDGFDVYMYTYIRIRKKKRRDRSMLYCIDVYVRSESIALHTARL